MATAAPEAAEVVEEEPKKKKPIVLIIGGVVGLIVLIVGIVLGTLFSQVTSTPSPSSILSTPKAQQTVMARQVHQATKKAMANPAKRPKAHLSSHALSTPTCKLNASSWSMSAAPKK